MQFLDRCQTQFLDDFRSPGLNFVGINSARRDIRAEIAAHGILGTSATHLPNTSTSPPSARCRPGSVISNQERNKRRLKSAGNDMNTKFKALWAYRNRPEGPYQPVGSNWTTIAANTNASTDEVKALRHERKILVTPSVKYMMEQVEADDVERNAKGQTVRIGKLRFSDGTQTEWTLRLQPGSTTKVECYRRRMPAGAMLGTREEPDVALGGSDTTDEDVVVSNAYFAEILGTAPPRYIKRVRRAKRARHTRHDAQRWLDEAIANTPVMPEVTYCPPGLPCGGRRMSDAFPGMVCCSTGQSGSIAWQDISDAIASREVWHESLAAMPAEDLGVLDAAQSARTWADVSPGGSVQGARKRGHKVMQAANDNLADALRKFAA